jgi:hypothetical protein
MAFVNGVPNRHLRHVLIGDDGNFINTKKNKLLIVFKLMDTMGRGEGNDAAEGTELLNQLISNATERKNRIQAKQPQPQPQNIYQFRIFLQNKGIPPERVEEIIKNKFGG